jgi:hypothetical protein
MSDNLRDRIAAVIDGVWQSGYPDAPADALADAVIEALKLKQEYTVEYTVDGCTPPVRQHYEWSCGHERITEHRDQAQWDANSFAEEEPDEKPSVVTRYVTEWKTDE